MNVCGSCLEKRKHGDAGPIVRGNPSKLTHRGRGRTENPRIYVGCLPCGKGRMVANVEKAGLWTERHWLVCPRSALGGSEGRIALIEALKGRG